MSERRAVRGKAKVIKVARLAAGPQGKMLRIRKMERIYITWFRIKEAEEKGKPYEQLKDEDLFLQQRDFDMYYHDLAALSRTEDHHDDVANFPFYEEAHKAIPDEGMWAVHPESEGDAAFKDAIEEYLGGLSSKELDW